MVQPYWPLLECVSRMPGPIFWNRLHDVGGLQLAGGLVDGLRTGVGRLLEGVLVEAGLADRELRVGEEVRLGRGHPRAQAEDVEGAGLGGRAVRDRRSHDWPACLATSCLVEDVGAEAAPREDLLEPVPPVLRRLPGLRRLAAAMPHHHRVLARGEGDVELHEVAVAVVGVPIASDDELAAGKEAALLGQQQRLARTLWSDRGAVQALHRVRGIGRRGRAREGKCAGSSDEAGLGCSHIRSPIPVRADRIFSVDKATGWEQCPP